MEVTEGFINGSICAARFFENIEVVEEHPAITINIEYPAPQAAPARIFRPKVCLGKSKSHPILSRRYRQSVGEITEPFSGIEIGV